MFGYEWLISIGLGLFLIIMGYYQLFHRLPKVDDNENTTISIIALKVSSWLIVGGLIATFLGLLNLIGLIPWWS